MTWIVDTNVISELSKPQPNSSVQAWFAVQRTADLFLSAVSPGEIEQGIASLGQDARAERLIAWLENLVLPRFKGRILNLDVEILRLWGTWMGEGQRKGRKRSILDTLIAATAYTHQLTLVTRHISDFPLEVPTFNPWS